MRNNSFYIHLLSLDGYHRAMGHVSVQVLIVIYLGKDVYSVLVLKYNYHQRSHILDYIYYAKFLIVNVILEYLYIDYLRLRHEFDSIVYN